MAEVKTRQTMWAEMKPDLYDGETCDQLRPRWYSYAAGDKEGGYDDDEIILDPKCFPPGTKVIVSEPECPKCGNVREQEYPQPESGPKFNAKCECGFDWEAWVNHQYS